MSVETFTDEDGEYGPKGKEYVFEPGTGPDLDDQEEEESSIEEKMQELVENEPKTGVGQADTEEDEDQGREQTDDEDGDDEDLLFANGEVVS